MTPLEQLAIQELPNAISLLQQAFAKANPAAPVPTSDEVLAAYETSFASSRAKDDAWLAAHPV